MALKVQVTPGIVIGDTDLVSAAALNLAAKPTITMTGTVDISDVDDLSIVTAKLANEAITTAKIAPEAVTTAKVAPGAITPAKVAPGAYHYASANLAAGVYGFGVSPAPASYSAGQIFRFKADAANTGAVDVNIDSLGAVNLYKGVNSELAAGDILAGQCVEIIHDGTHFQMLSPVATRPAVVVGTSSNLRAYNNAAALTTSLDVTADEVVVKDTAGNAVTLSSVAVTANISTSAAANGRDTAAALADNWYYVFVIWNGTTTASLLSLSTSPTLPSGYTHKALVGVVKNAAVGSAALRRFWQAGRRIWFTPQLVFTGTNAPSTNFTAHTTGIPGIIPPNASAWHGTVGRTDTSSTVYGLEIVGAGSGTTTTVPGLRVVTGAAAAAVLNFTSTHEVMEVPLVEAQKFYWRSTSTTPAWRLEMHGFSL